MSIQKIISYSMGVLWIMGFANPAGAGMYQGNMSQGNMSQGGMYQGNMYQGNMYQGGMYQGNMSQDNMQGNMSQDNRSQDNMQGNMSQDNRSQDNMQGNRSAPASKHFTIDADNILRTNALDFMKTVDVPNPSVLMTEMGDVRVLEITGTVSAQGKPFGRVLGEVISGLPRLQTLTLSNNNMGNAGVLQMINELNGGGSNLMELNIRNNNLDGNIVLPIARSLSRLTRLELDGNHIDHKGVGDLVYALPQMPNLVALNLLNNNISEPDKARLRSFVNSLNQEGRRISLVV